MSVFVESDMARWVSTATCRAPLANSGSLAASGPPVTLAVPVVANHVFENWHPSGPGLVPLVPGALVLFPTEPSGLRPNQGGLDNDDTGRSRRVCAPLAS